MPNFWTKTTQYIDETIHGKQNDDMLFNGILRKKEVIEQGMLNLQGYLNSLYQVCSTLQELFKNISLSLIDIYDGKENSIYYPLFERISTEHNEMSKSIKEFSEKIKLLLRKTSEWNSISQQADKIIFLRDTARKDYKHYDEKVSKIFCKQTTKQKGLAFFKMNQYQYIDRNIEKYKTALHNYTKISHEAYYSISTILKQRYNIVNPIMIELIKEESECFKQLANASRPFEKIHVEYKAIDKDQMSIYYRNEVYDPWKYIFGGKKLLTLSPVELKEFYIKNEENKSNYNKMILCQEDDKKPKANIEKSKSVKANTHDRELFNSLIDDTIKEVNTVNNKNCIMSTKSHINPNKLTTKNHNDYIEEDIKRNIDQIKNIQLNQGKQVINNYCGNDIFHDFF